MTVDLTEEKSEGETGTFSHVRDVKLHLDSRCYQFNIRRDQFTIPVCSSLLYIAAIFSTSVFFPYLQLFFTYVFALSVIRKDQSKRHTAKTLGI